VNDATICKDVSEHLKGEIKKMLRMAKETRKGISAELEDYKVKEYHSVGRAPKGKATIYVYRYPFLPALAPGARNVREMVEKERPFMCRATRTPAAVDVAACYTPGYMFKIYKRLRERNLEDTKAFYEKLAEKYGKSVTVSQTDAERGIEIAIYDHALRLKHIAESSASAILDTCHVEL